MPRHELVVNLYSNGHQLNKRVRSEILDKCGVEGTIGVMGYQRMDIQCTEKNFEPILMSHIGTMPEMQKFLKAEPPLERARLMKKLIELGRSSISCQDTYEHSDIQQSLVVVTYIEILMLRFDANKNGTLEEAEVEVAFPIYKPIIKNVAPEEGDANLMLGFKYLLQNGEVPKLDSILDKLRFLYWSRTYTFEPVKRGRLFDVFTVLRDFLTGSSGSAQGLPVIRAEDSCLTE